jgi:TonB family protein
MKSPLNMHPRSLTQQIIVSVVVVLCLSCAFAQTTTDTGGDKVYKVGGAVTPPVAIDHPDPEYSKEARHEKYQGTCVLWLVVGADGRPHDIKVRRTLGLGLDEKAVEAVKQWRFKPAMKDGKPVAVEISVQVDFHLYVDAPTKNGAAPARFNSQLMPTPPQAHVDPTPQFTQEQLAQMSALWDAKLSPEQQVDLRAKCTTYVGKSLEDVQRKRVPLPPHECASVLGWMRSLDVESLYIAKPSDK